RRAPTAGSASPPETARRRFGAPAPCSQRSSAGPRSSRRASWLTSPRRPARRACSAHDRARSRRSPAAASRTRARARARRAPVAEAQELERVVPLLERLGSELDALVSIDTYSPAVARAAIAAGARIVNDVSALRNSELARVCADTGAALVVMHTLAPPGQRRQ